MTVVPTEIPTAGAMDTLEVRWIAAGPLVTQVRQWFGRFQLDPKYGRTHTCRCRACLDCR